MPMTFISPLPKMTTIRKEAGICIGKLLATTGWIDGQLDAREIIVIEEFFKLIPDFDSDDRKSVSVHECYPKTQNALNEVIATVKETVTKAELKLVDEWMETVIKADGRLDPLEVNLLKKAKALLKIK